MHYQEKDIRHGLLKTHNSLEKEYLAVLFFPSKFIAMLLRSFFFLSFLFLLACNEPRPTQTTSPTTPEPTTDNDPIQPKNVILMIGDGMGLTQISAGLYANNNKLSLERFPVIGLHKSYASNNLITDSAAGATAFACGVKTYNGAIGVDPDTTSVVSILEEAERNGYSTGLITTSTIVHATPASFAAHQPARRMYEAIALDMVQRDIDLLIGGGKKFFDNRKDGLNLYDDLRNKGYQVSDFFQKDFKKLRLEEGKKLAYFTSNDDPLPKLSGRDYFVRATELAPMFLESKSDTGFFLMIEGAQIDWGGHANNSDYIISEMIEFDEAIGTILEYAEEDGETLVIVTADHETGGYAINPGSKMGKIVPGFTSDYHTGALIPVFAYGPGAELFAGIYENTAIHTKMRKALGF